MKSVSIKYFPWAPGLPWKMKNGKYVIPELPLNNLAQVLKDKKIVVCAPGEALEAYYSFFILEILNYHFPQNKFSWFGNKNYSSFLKAQGIAKSFDSITVQDLKRFPTPVFLDKNNRIYFNSTFNYTHTSSYYLTDTKPNKTPIIQNILGNACIPWEERFQPKLRNSDFSKLYKINKFSNKKIILLVDLNNSVHDFNLEWNTQQFKSFIALASQLDQDVVILTNEPNRYWGTKAKSLKFQLELFVDLLTKTKWLISNVIDFPLIAVGHPVNIIFKETNKYLDLNKNVEILPGASIHLIESFRPIDIYNYIKEISE